jgi:hypothetical protein
MGDFFYRGEHGEARWIFYQIARGLNRREADGTGFGEKVELRGLRSLGIHLPHLVRDKLRTGCVDCGKR